MQKNITIHVHVWCLKCHHANSPYTQSQERKCHTRKIYYKLEFWVHITTLRQRSHSRSCELLVNFQQRGHLHREERRTSANTLHSPPSGSTTRSSAQYPTLSPPTISPIPTCDTSSRSLNANSFDASFGHRCLVRTDETSLESVRREAWASSELPRTLSLLAWSNALLVMSRTERMTPNSAAMLGWCHSSGQSSQPALKTLPAVGYVTVMMSPFEHHRRQ